MDIKIPIHHFSCKKQEVLTLEESYVLLGEQYIEYVVRGWFRQWNDETGMLDAERYIDDRETYKKGHIVGYNVFLTKEESYTVMVYVDGTKDFWVRFETQSAADAFRRQLHEYIWPDIVK